MRLIFNPLSGRFDYVNKPPYGSIWGNEIGWTTGSAVQNTWYPINDADTSDGQLYLIAHDGSGKLTVARAEIYKIDFSAALECNLPSKHIQSGISINGVTANDGITHEEEAAANAQFIMASTAILNLTANSTIQIVVRTTDTGTPTISCDHLNVSVLMV